ncbi:MAG: fused MFS/spermidine synthase [Pseudohongiellaceae bacterium]
MNKIKNKAIPLTEEKTLPQGLVVAAAFVSGFTIMTIEMLGARILSPYFGGSLSVWGSIITIFMLALAMGYLIGGRLSTRSPNPVLYGSFFIAAGITSLPVVLFADAVMEPIFLSIEDPRYGSLFASIFLFFIPTSILGMISPYSVRLLVKTQQHSGHIAGLLFFVSTVGSAIGTLGTSFYFVLWFEVNQILWGAVAALIAVGCLTVLAHMAINKQTGSE